MSSIGLSSLQKIPQNPKERLDFAFKTETPKSLPKLNIPQWYSPKAWTPQIVQDFSKKLFITPKESDKYEGNIKDNIKFYENIQSFAHRTMLASPIATVAAAIPFLPTLPVLGIGGLVGALSYFAKKACDQQKLAYLGKEYNDRIEVLENDPIAKSVTEDVLTSPKKTSFNDISKIIKSYNKNNESAKKQYKKDILDVFVPYKKQNDSNFYEKNLGDRPETFYNDIIPKTADSEVTPKHFSWLADNGAIPTPETPATDYNAAEDLNGMPPSNTGVFVDDDKLNRKTAFMIKVMKKYGLPIENADTIENFHNKDLNKLNYKRALRLFKAEHCPAKEQFKKIRDIIKEKYAEFSKEDASLQDKKDFFNNNIVIPILKEANNNNNSNSEFIRTLSAILASELYHIKR